MAKEKTETMRFALIALSLVGVFVFVYYTQGWNVGKKLDNATYAQQTLAESGPYSLSVTANQTISGDESKLVEDTLVTFFDERGLEFVDAQTAVDEGGSVLWVYLDSTPIDAKQRTFSVDMHIISYVYRRSSSGNYYKQAARIFASGKHGFATADVFNEAISTTATIMAKDLFEQYQKDNP